MPPTVVKCIFLLNIFICLTQAALLRNPVTESQQNNNNYQQNSLEQPRFPPRTSSSSKEKYYYDQVNDLSNNILDSFDHRYPDGSYEYRYELSDGQARYERGYFIKINDVKSLVVVGYYSYRMTDGKYVTVFYNADRYGYRQNQAITRDALPDLPRSIEVPEIKEDASEKIETSTKRSSQHNVNTTKRIRF